MGEVKKGMPFVQNLRRRLQAGEPEEKVLQRKLAFDDVSILRQMLPGLKKTAGLSAIDLILVGEDGKHGKAVGGDGGVLAGMEELPAQAHAAIPGQPTFAFQKPIS